jgi:hypothetical protein
LPGWGGAVSGHDGFIGELPIGIGLYHPLGNLSRASPGTGEISPAFEAVHAFVAQSVRSPAIALTSKAGLPYKPPDFGRGRPDQIGIVGPRERPGCRRAAVSGDDR